MSGVRSANMRKKVNIGTWNVRIFEAGKLANLIQEMKKLDIDILGVAKTWWPDAGVCNTREVHSIIRAIRIGIIVRELESLCQNVLRTASSTLYRIRIG